MTEGRTLSRRRLIAFAAVAALIVLELGARLAPPAWWEAGLFQHHWLDARIARAIARDRSAPEPLTPTARDGLLEGLEPALDAASGLADDNRYNRHGYRGPDWDDSPPPGVARVAVLGDSRVFGLYVGRDQTLSARIGARDGVEGLNFGVTGAGTFEALDTIVGDALATSPSMAVLLFDINPSVQALAPADPWGRRGSFAQVLRGSALLRRSEMLVRHLVVGAEGRVPSVELADYVVQYGQLVQRLRDGGVSEVVIVVGATAVADRAHVFSGERYDRYRAGARSIAEAHGVRTVEVESLIADLSEAEAYRGIGIHWSPQVLERIAAAVLDGATLTPREVEDVTPEPTPAPPTRPSPEAGDPALR